MVAPGTGASPGGLARHPSCPAFRSGGLGVPRNQGSTIWFADGRAGGRAAGGGGRGGAWEQTWRDFVLGGPPPGRRGLVMTFFMTIIPVAKGVRQTPAAPGNRAYRCRFARGH